MFYNLKQRCLLLLVFVIVGLSISLSFNAYRPLQATATTAEIIVDSKTAAVLEAEGKHFYSIAQFQKAIDSWQQAAKIYAEGDFLDRARVLSNIALAHSQLGNHSEAKEIIADSLNLIDRPQTSDGQVKVLARVLNNQGIIQLKEANTAAAIATWEQAKANYQQTGDELGVIRASINQSSAYKESGFYRRAYKTLNEVEESLTQQPDSLLKVSALRSYGDILHLVGQQERSRQVLEQSLTLASRLNSASETGKILLLLGSTYRAIEPAKALELYDRALETCQQQCPNTDLPLQIYLAKLNLLPDIPPQQYADLIRAVKAEFARLPIDRTNIDRQINFAYSLIQLAYPPNANDKAVLSKTEITQLIDNIIEQSKAINYPKARSYALGLRGKVAEEQENWLDARDYTEQALILAQGLDIPETSYLWHWQMGRIERALGEPKKAIADYFQAVELLKFLSRDIAAIDPQVQYSFRDGVEPVYRELVSLLLNNLKQEGADNLERAREIMESLQQAELNNFFREACLDAQTVEVDTLDRQAAIIYPIILSDRLEIIVSLPDRPLKHYTTKISQQQLEVIIAKLRYNIVVRSRRNFYRPAQKLYELLISPISEDLVRDGIKTLVFVPDGAFRNVPFSALYDGDRYLIENYSIALTPGLRLLDPRPLTEEKLHTVAAGLTKSIDGFSALNYVKAELEQIEETVDSVVLLDREFTPESLKQEIESSNYPIVHIATHGQFSSSMDDTFLLAWNDKININELDRILQTRNFSAENAIELLVLSACETATGDNRAALGLAGMAVRAGAKSTLATLWAVNDRATAKLMSNFYRQLSDKHLPKAEAVRQAQLFLLQNDKYKHPFYWAPYVLLGNWL